MITLLTGENTFEVERTLERLVTAFGGRAERVDGSVLDARQLPDLLMGMTLFADKRLVIVKNLSENKTVWIEFEMWLGRVSDDIDLVLVETKPDKRTATYKALKKVAKVQEFSLWTERDGVQAEAWVVQEAKSQGVKLNKKSVQLILRRVGLNQWLLFHAIEKLALLKEVTDEIIENSIDAQPAENIFNLFDAALRGESRRVVDMLETLAVTEDPYRLFALLGSQSFQLAAIDAAGPSDPVAKDFAIHPYVLSKLSSTASRLGKSRMARIVQILAATDDDMKLSKAEPWLLIERALVTIATLH